MWLTRILFLRSPKLGSSPFAKQTQQPFVDNASCRSRLSDYGFTSESEDEQDWDCCYGDDMESPVKEQLPPGDFGGFWAEVGAVGMLLYVLIMLAPYAFVRSDKWPRHDVHAGIPCSTCEGSAYPLKLSDEGSKQEPFWAQFAGDGQLMDCMTAEISVMCCCRQLRVAFNQPRCQLRH